MMSAHHCAVAAGVLLIGTATESGAQEASEREDAQNAPDARQPEAHTVVDPSARLQAQVNELQDKVQNLEEKAQERELEALALDAQRESQVQQESSKPAAREFLEGGLALQKLNPEMTFFGDLLAAMVPAGGRFYASETDRSGFPIRCAGFHLQHVLDPYSMFKSALHISPYHGLGLEEAYITWFGVLPGLSVSAGRFRQNFGVVNRWHEHDLDQTEYPLALRTVLGNDGLIGDGFAVRWLLPSLWAHANEVLLEVVDGTSSTLFSGQHFSVPVFTSKR